MVVDVTFASLTQARLHNPCKRATNASGGVGMSCQGGVLVVLPPAMSLSRGPFLGSDLEPTTGEHLLIDGHRAIVSYRDTFVCGGIRGVQARIAAAISRVR